MQNRFLSWNIPATVVWQSAFPQAFLKSFLKKVFVAIGRKSDPTHEDTTPNALTTTNILAMPPPATSKNRKGSTPAIVTLVVEKSAESLR
ncbi:MAG: hypothetical protein LBL45_09760, partial [Treponema sp.]|nr:hypothetical protein [Treponema sp.]